jgi:hypothetical protein
MNKACVCLLVSLVALFLMPLTLSAQTEDMPDCCFQSANIAGGFSIESNTISFSEKLIIENAIMVFSTMPLESQSVFLEASSMKIQHPAELSSRFACMRR